MADDTALPRRRRWPYAVGILAFLGYAAWMLGPYIRSIVVRDAAVTTWSHVATTPIRGTIDFFPRPVTGVVGPEGVIATVHDDHASRNALEQAQADLERNASRITELELQIAEINELDADRQQVKAVYAKTFRDQLDVRIATLAERVEIAKSLLAVVKQIAERKSALMEKGVGSPNDADEAQLRVHQAAVDLANLEADLAFAKVRREAADRGVFADDTGDDPGWAQGERMELKMERKLTRLELVDAKAERAYLEARLASEQADLERQSEASVLAPPGSIVWSERVSSGAVVLAGQAVAEWLDCGLLLVDVPVSDVEAALLRIGDPASVLLEGETTERAARIIRLRGAASTLDRNDLIALAKGRGEGDAQALLQLDSAGAAFDSCPVGRAAFVDFPNLGLLDVILARLRL
jgi:multidrug resistance efflux pump